MKYLSRISNPDELKALSVDELILLAEEIREVILSCVSETGGHLASSLGAVELTLAMHYVFNTPHDKIVWDVGHQAYAHKIITGRLNMFSSLRQIDGMCPFISPAESIYDAFVSGHAGNAISAACGISEAFGLTGNPSRVLAVIGDGSLSNGLSFEALNFSGPNQRNMIVVLNDNKMFISGGVGAVADYLSRLLTSPIVRDIKEEIKNTLEQFPVVGKQLYRLAKHIETNLKEVVSGGTLFEQLGFRYLGPIDGHNLHHLVQTFRNISLMHGPIFLHVVTEKGHGYKPAVDDPENFHGVGKFQQANGELPVDNGRATYSKVFGDALTRMASNDDRIVAITAAMMSGTGLSSFAKTHPKHFYDVGIAEGHAVTMAAGMAKSGLKPVVAIYSTFLQRAYDEIIHDVALQKAPVIFAVDRAGLVGPDGPTHHGAYDIAYLRSIPNMTVLAPRDQLMLETMLEASISLDGPVAIRFPREKVVEDPLPCGTFRPGELEILRVGKRLAVFCAGPLCYTALDACQEFPGVAVVDIKSIKPLDSKAVIELVRTCGGRFVVVEDGTVKGGLGSAILEVLSGMECGLKFKLLGIPDSFVAHGATDVLRERLGLDAAGIAQAVQSLI